jgi:hypothetical protein
LSRRKQKFSITTQSENFSLLSSFMKFFGPSPPMSQKKNFLSLKSKSVVLLFPLIVSSLSLFQRINQISLHLLSRKSIALFHKGVFIYQNAVISFILLSSRHRRERERAESANTLSLKKRDRGLNPVDHKSTIKERACVCDHRLAREYISLI